MRTVMLALGAAAIVVVAACDQDKTTAPDVTRPLPGRPASRTMQHPPVNGLGVNVNTLRDGEGTYTASYLSQLGAKVVRFSVDWSDVQPSSNQWNQTGLNQTVARITAAGAVPLAILAYAPGWACPTNCLPPSGCNSAGILPGVPDTALWRGWVRRIVDSLTLRGVEYFEIWNEPNAPCYFNGTAQQYDAIARIAVAEIHASGKAAVGPAAGQAAGDSAFVRGRDAALKAVGDSFDVISFHAYAYPSLVQNIAKYYRDSVAGNRPIWITEIGPGEQSMRGPPADDRMRANWVLNGLVHLQNKNHTWQQLLWWHLFTNNQESNLLYATQAGGWYVDSVSPLFATFAAGAAELPLHVFYSAYTHEFSSQLVEYRGVGQAGQQLAKFYGYDKNMGGLTLLKRCVYEGSGKGRRLGLGSCPSGFLEETLDSIYLRSTPGAGWLKLFSISGPNHNFYYTTDSSEYVTALNSGWSDEGVFAYARQPTLLDPTSPTLTAATRVAVHVAWSPINGYGHTYYTDNYNNPPAGYNPSTEIQFALAATQESGTLPLYRCFDGNTGYRVSRGNCPFGTAASIILGYAHDVNATGVTADHVLKEFLYPYNGTYYSTADPDEQAVMLSNGWEYQRDVAKVWF